MQTRFNAWRCFVLAGLILGAAAPRLARAQESKSMAAAQELAKYLDSGKLDSFSAKSPESPDEFVAALYFPGQQLLVVSAKYAVPQLLEEKIAKGEHRDVYIDLQSASKPETKFFVTDLNADGLKMRERDDQPFDGIEQAGKSITFDQGWRRKQNMSEEDFAKAYADADAKYQRMLVTLLNGAKKPS